MATKRVLNLATGEVSDVPYTQEDEDKAAEAAGVAAAAEAIANHPDQLEADCAAYLNGGGTKIDIRKAFKAKVISDLAFRLGVAPGALTGAQLNAERNRIAAIYKAL